MIRKILHQIQNHANLILFIWLILLTIMGICIINKSINVARQNKVVYPTKSNFFEVKGYVDSLFTYKEKQLDEAIQKNIDVINLLKFQLNVTKLDIQKVNTNVKELRNSIKINSNYSDSSLNAILNAFKSI